MDPKETTNRRLAEAIVIVEELIRWAEADAEHSEESDAPAQAQDDRIRATMLRQVREKLLGCER